LPAGDWKSAVAGGTLNPGVYTAGASGSTQEHKFSALATTDGTTTFEKVASDDYITIKKTLNPCFIFTRCSLQSEFVQNKWNTVRVAIQIEVTNSGAWNDIGTSFTMQTVWPNVAKVSGASDHYADGVMFSGVSLTEGYRLRIITTTNYATTAPLVNLSASVDFYYQ
jgi:hypothetical protein